MSVKNRIKEFVDSRGMSVYRFRADTGISQKTAYDLYNNPFQLPNSSVLTKICDTYRVQPNEILIWLPSDDETDRADSVSTSKHQH